MTILSRFLSSFFLLLLAAGACDAALVRTDGPARIANPSGALIGSDETDGDPATNRHLVQMAIACSFTTSGVSNNSGSYRVLFELRDESGVPQPMDDGAGNPLTSITTDAQTVSLLLGNSASLSFAVDAAPAAALDLTKRYRVQATVQRLVSAVWTTQVVRQGEVGFLVGLPTTVSPDAAYNIHGRVESPALASPVMVRNADGTGGFAVSGSVTLLRYDDYQEAAPPALDAAVTTTVTLHDDTLDADVPLAVPSQTQLVPLPGFVENGGVREPAVTTLPVAMTVELADWSLLNAAHVYSLKLEVTYTGDDGSEVPAVPVPVGVGAPQRLLALSGALRFGGVIDGRFAALTGDPRASFTDNGDGTWDGNVVIAAGSGQIGGPIRRFGNGVTGLDVVLFSNGDLACLGGNLGFNTTETDLQVVSGVRVIRGPAVLSNAGLKFSQFGVILPTGMGFTTTAVSRRLRPVHQWPDLPCGNDLLPLNSPVLTIEAAAYSVPVLHVVQEGHPVRMITPAIEWNVAAGTFSLGVTGDAEYVRRIDDQTHQNATGVLPPGNDGFFRSAVSHQSSVIAADVQGRGVLTAAFQFTAGSFQSHHPFNASVAWSGTGTLLLDQGQVVPGSSSLTQPEMGQFPYQAGCSQGGGCAQVQAVTWPFLATSDWQFTLDGGLRAPVQFAQDEVLRWGKNGSGAADYAHRTHGFGTARFHMTGTTLRPTAIGGNSYPIAQRAAILHFTGCSAPGEETLVERPGVLPAGPAREGRADYAGLNFRAVEMTNRSASSHLAVGDILDYPLHAAAKYYARYGGVSGRHQAAAATPGNPSVSTVVMFGFQVQLDGLKLGYLDSDTVFSLTGGSIAVPEPSGFDQTFAELKFDCAGRPVDAVLADDTENLLVHWNTAFTPLTFRFQPKISGGCPSTDQGVLVLGAAVNARALTNQPLHAELGFFANGQMVPKGAKGDYAGVSSELMLPAQLKLKGGNGPDYTLTPHGKGYFSSADPAVSGQAAAPGDGWINLYGALDVPFFQDVKVQAQVRNSSNAQGGLVDLMGGWPASDAAGNLQGWGEGTGMAMTPFNDVNFDAMQRGYPMGQSLTVYRNPPAKQYRPLAEQDWLQVVKLGYSLKWDMAARRFTTLGEESTDLVVVKAKHRLLSLTSSTAEITFGVKIEGFPTLNVSKLLTDQINSGLNGLFTSLTNAGLQASGLNEAVQGFDALVSAQIGDLLNAPLDAALDGADFVFNPLLWSQMGLTGVISEGAAKYAEQIAGLAKPIADGQGEFTTALRSRLGQVITALSILEGFIPGESPEQNLAQLARAVLSSAGDGLNPVLATFLTQIIEAVGTPAQAQKSVPAFEELRLTVARLRTRITGLRDTLDSVNNPLRAELDRAIGLKANYEAQIQGTLSAYFIPLGTSSVAIQAAIADRGLDTMRRELKERVRRVLITSALAGPVQAAIKQYLAEPQAAFRGTLDSLFGEVNRAIRDAVKSVIPEGAADTLGLNSIDAGLGALSSTFKGLGLDGYAQINGDSLQRLRIDGKMVLKAADEMEFRGWLQIDALNAKNPRTKCYCDDPAAMRDGVEVIVGGEAPFNLFAEGDNSTKLRVQGQFAFGSCGPGTPALLGLGGSFFLQGSISVASIEIKELGLTFAFGKASNYFGARARAAFQGYEFAGAFFAGSTCGLAPLLDVDPDIHALLLNPDLALLGPGDDPENTRITGLYVYAEGWMPLNNVIGIPDSCLFSLRAGAGAGPFAFVKSGGQDQLLLGSKQFFGITADILCIAHAEAKVKLIGALRIPLGSGIREEVKGPSSSLALRLLGLAEFELDIGPCPFCISFSKDVKFHAQVGGDGVSFGFGH